MRRISQTAGIAALLTLTSAALPAAAQDVAGLLDTLVQQGVDMPDQYGTGLRAPASPVAEEIHSFYDRILLPMKIGISLFVLGLLVWVAVKFNKRANPTPSKFTHNTALEVVWTAVPVAILLVIAVPSFELLGVEDVMPDGQVFDYEADPSQTEFAFENDFPKSRRVTDRRHLNVFAVSDGERRMLQAGRDFDVDGYGDENMLVTLKDPLPAGESLSIVAGRSRVGVKPWVDFRPLLPVYLGPDRADIVPAPTITIKATGWQWGWSYSYPDYGDFEFDALMQSEAEAGERLYRLATTNDIVVPAGETIRIITTARDVIHSWTIPNFGVKVDAIPGRLNETWFTTDQESIFYGQCSEICGKDHAFMPIAVRVVSREEFEAWVDERRELEGLEPVFATHHQAAEGGEQRQAALQ